MGPSFGRPAALTGSGAGERIGAISEAPSHGGTRRILLTGAALVGGAIVGLAWLFLGNDSNSGASASLAALAQAPGIAPPNYAYLDNGQVALYLGQLEGGLATSEQLTQQLTQSRSAGLNVGGSSLGGSTGSQSTAQREVTPTATARFYQLLDLLGRDGFLHTIDASLPPEKLKRAFARVREGSFVKLTNCSVQVPDFVRLEQLSRTSRGATSPSDLLLSATNGDTRYNALEIARAMAGRTNHLVGNATAVFPAGAEQRIGKAERALDKAGPNPLVPLSTCDGRTDNEPKGVDYLFPIHLADLSTEQSLLAGPVTIVGMLVRSVRDKSQDYVDQSSFTTFAAPVSRLDQLAGGQMYNELVADAVVLNPGAVILPMAIYK